MRGQEDKQIRNQKRRGKADRKKNAHLLSDEDSAKLAGDAAEKVGGDWEEGATTAGAIPVAK